MNKIYKVVWSKVKNCYVVASELAKSYTKSPSSRAVNRTVVASVLACVLSCGAVTSVQAATFISNSAGTPTSDDFEYVIGVGTNTVSGNGTLLYKVVFDLRKDIGPFSVFNFTVAYDVKTGTAKYYTDIDQGNDINTYELTPEEIQRALGDTPLSSLLAAVKGGVSYDAGNGITISSDNKVYV